ncbi:hypothetical protein [Gordonia liuliyuniae]|uniref:Mce-associated membrane protein n=1 Tax=Gordonia liuliyuniae TaxID=2911517 RepID=A0ABS9IUC1_9ACTN|nr:hypothetical protein [Gordonia liuliyuniae]MCF8589090.1 hypothetical protein [Gordonia liuliyuniae]
MSEHRRKLFSAAIIGSVGAIILGACGTDNDTTEVAAAPESSIENVAGVSDADSAAIADAVSATLHEYQEGSRKSLLKQTCGELHGDLAKVSDEEFDTERQDTLGKRGDFRLSRILSSTEAGGSKFVELDLENAGGSLSRSTTTRFVWELSKAGSSWKVCSVGSADS